MIYKNYKYPIKFRHVFAFISSITMYFMYKSYDNTFDKQAYLDVIAKLDFMSLDHLRMIFNNYEVGSFLVFYFINKSGLNYEFALGLLISIYTYILLYSIRNIYIQFGLLLIVIFYSQDFWLNQIRASIAVSFCVLFINLYSQNKKYFFSQIVPTSFHLQSLFVLPAMFIARFRYSLIAIIASTIFIFSLRLIFTNISIGSIISLSEKMEIYNNAYGENSGSLFMRLRIAFTFLLSSFDVLYRKKFDKFTSLMIFNGFYATLFSDNFIYFGRITSFFIFFEPFYYCLRWHRFKYFYLFFLFSAAAIKFLATR